MNKFLIVLLVVLSVNLMSCPGPHDPVVKLTFEEAVQEVYEMTASTLFYSLNGKTKNPNASNKATSSNEIPGVCTDYSIEFAYYWNEFKNYDEIYGKAYFAMVASNSSTLNIVDTIFVPDGTSKIRENSGKFTNNANLQEMDGVYRDTLVKTIIFSGNNIRHFSQNVNNHMWIVIKINDDWYDLEPTWWDVIDDNNYPPNKISF